VLLWSSLTRVFSDRLLPLLARERRRRELAASLEPVPLRERGGELPTLCLEATLPRAFWREPPLPEEPCPELLARRLLGLGGLSELVERRLPGGLSELVERRLPEGRSGAPRRSRQS